MPRSASILVLVATMLLVACSTAPKTAEDRAELERRSRGALALMKEQDPSLRGELEDAYGYAIFPTVGKGGLGVGGAYGRGIVYEEGEMVGYCDLSQGTIGLQIGGQAYSELILFEYEEALDHFKTGNFAFSAQASAVAIESGASADAKYDRGVKVITMPKAGAMLEASIGGQKFDYRRK